MERFGFFFYPKSAVAEAAVRVAAQFLSSKDMHHPIALIRGLTELSQPSCEHTDARRDAIIAIKNLAKANHMVLKGTHF
jgi:hypothetical protein